MRTNVGTRWTGDGSADPDERTTDSGRRSRRGFLGAVATVAFGASAGCVTVESASATVTEEFDAAGPLSVENDYGDLSVRTGDVDAVVAELTKRDGFGNEDALSKVSLRRDRSGDGLSLSVARETGDGLVHATTADLSVTVPDSVEVSSVAADYESLTVEGVSGDLDATVDDGDGEITDLDGDLTLMVDDGEATVSGVAGDVDVTVDDGDVEIDDAEGTVSAGADDGDVTVTEAGVGRIQTDDGGVTVRGATDVDRIRTDDGDVEAEIRGLDSDGAVVVDDAEVELRLASSVECRVLAVTDGGEISTEGLPGDVSVDADEERVEADMGGADHRLRVESDFGDITLSGLD
ncbi:hypothetical protein [Halosimplex sp. J119]